ncbi:50S ribosomal protein L22 [Patescibacteria group bacterium]|nr:50S ribosomal protein L22 [Patescibacteria group bacterium]MBU1016431.1 50S ribosomal protein L22 [Patescibacteria group bacterium]MBU1684929.1 50S ribosomal protein L22 [Patescibacteria group bacterium]MBU1939043.1 50S ribosomal protein L22 [Patescibacteria group bacterium]
MKAHLRKIRISPKKANLVAGIVRGKKVNDALAILKFMPKKGADILYKVIHSAALNAKNNFKQSIDDLFITQILVTKGPTYKRSIPISRGRVHPIGKRTSHITVEVGLADGSKPKVPVKEEKVETPKKKEVKKETSKKSVTKKKTEKKLPVKKTGKKSNKKG